MTMRLVARKMDLLVTNNEPRTKMIRMSMGGETISHCLVTKPTSDAPYESPIQDTAVHHGRALTG